MTNDILNWSLKPAPYASITLVTAFCTILMIINTENSTEGRTWNIDTYHTEPISQSHRALQRYLNNSTEQTNTNKTSQFRTMRQILRLMQASSARGLNFVQVKGLILGLWDLQWPLKFNLLVMINEL